MSYCIECKELTTKYKCPRCLEPYCSISCYKEHKKSECQPKTEKLLPKHIHDAEPTLHNPFKTEDTVRPEKLEELKSCEALHSLLYNPHLRNLLREVDVAPNAWTAMRAAMQEPLFIEFADECLKVVEPQSPDSE